MGSGGNATKTKRLQRRVSERHNAAYLESGSGCARVRDTTASFEGTQCGCDPAPRVGQEYPFKTSTILASLASRLPVAEVHIASSAQHYPSSEITTASMPTGVTTYTVRTGSVFDPRSHGSGELNRKRTQWTDEVSSFKTAVSLYEKDPTARAVSVPCGRLYDNIKPCFELYRESLRISSPGTYKTHAEQARRQREWELTFNALKSIQDAILQSREDPSSSDKAALVETLRDSCDKLDTLFTEFASEVERVEEALKNDNPELEPSGIRVEFVKAYAEAEQQVVANGCEDVEGGQGQPVTPPDLKSASTL